MKQIFLLYHPNNPSKTHYGYTAAPADLLSANNNVTVQVEAEAAAHVEDAMDK